MSLRLAALPRGRDTIAVLLCAACMLVSATLLFLVQPMFTKMALPAFGGSPQVWNVSVVFYQVVLLLGYSYAHVLRRHLAVRWAALLHIALVLAIVLFLPIHIPSGWSAPPNGVGVQVWLLWLLLVSVGAPFFVLSATSPLVQSWFTTTGHDDAENPYFLYAASNVGSLTALVLYPLAIESILGISWQTRIWSIGFAAFVPLMLGCAWLAWNSKPAPHAVAVPHSAAGGRTWIERGIWILLAFIPSSLMLGVTTHLSNAVAPIPLLWTFPLALYLLTFILAFARRPIALSKTERVLPYVLLPLVFMLALQLHIDLVFYLALNLLAFFVLALVCHSRLALLRPSHLRLTEFYLCLSIGGALGGIFNTFVAPEIFPDLGEYPLAIVIACLVTGVLRGGRFQTILDFCWPLALAALLAASLACIDKRIAIGVALLAAFAAYGRGVRFAGSIGAIFVVCALVIHPFGNAIFGERNFFGIKWVLADRGNYHLLIHSGTLHGIQSRDASRLREPLSYYSRRGPLGQAFQALGSRLHGRSVAAVGLGAGAAACYADSTERWTFYEIDRQVIRIAENPKYFSFLSLCTPAAPVIAGDARLELAAQHPVSYSLMILDAYSADAVPTHLLTVEALDLYLRNLAEDGVLLFNISNQYFDLRPVLGNLAEARGLAAYYQEDAIAESTALRTGQFGSRWVAMARKSSDLGSISSDPRWTKLGPYPGVPLWTDDYSSLIRVLYGVVH
jgi:hypothetical protein